MVRAMARATIGSLPCIFIKAIKKYPCQCHVDNAPHTASNGYFTYSAIHCIPSDVCDSHACVQGKYVVLFFYPLDFTFVCPTEITAFSDKHGDFKSKNAEVQALSSIHQCHSFLNLCLIEGVLATLYLACACTSLSSTHCFATHDCAGRAYITLAWCV